MHIQPKLTTIAAMLLSVGLAAPAAAWEPTKPIEFVIPAGTGGGADQMARFTQGVTAKHSLIKQPVIPINKSGGAGAEGFLDVKASKVTITRSSSRSPTCSPRRLRPGCPSTGRT
jgi:tripartite-type tricarboxylate transporter receptor subunit TctC